MSSSRDVLQQVVTAIDSTKPGPALDEIRAMIAEAGITPNMHVGDPPESFEGDDRKTVEWILGNFADIIDSQAWYAMNSFINYAAEWLVSHGC